jgi:hypothetical protein
LAQRDIAEGGRGYSSRRLPKDQEQSPSRQERHCRFVIDNTIPIGGTFPDRKLPADCAIGAPRNQTKCNCPIELKSKQRKIMKYNRISQVVATLIFGFGQVIGHSAVYYGSSQVNGSTEAALTPKGLGAGDFVTEFGTLIETFYYDPVAQTLQAVGTVTVSPSSGSFNINGSSVAPGSGSASLTIGNNGVVSFDMTYHYEGDFFNGYDFNSTLSIPISGSGIYNGQAFAGSWNLLIPIDLQINASTPTSLTFSEENANGATIGSLVVGGTDLVDGNSDSTYEYTWGVSGVATAVPEPTALVLVAMMLPFGAGALRMLRKKQTP